MYNFRYHLITIVSIFLSLFVGLLLGAAIAGSDLVRNTSNEMVDSLLQRFDTLTNQNAELKSQLTNETTFSQELYDGWMNGRLEGRTVVILVSDTDASSAVVADINETLKLAGAATIKITVHRPSFGIQDTRILALLQDVVRPISGEPYERTLARRLASEWAFIYVEPDEPEDEFPDDPDNQDPDAQNPDGQDPDGQDPDADGDTPYVKPPYILTENEIILQYPLTRVLLSNNIISIDVDYTSLLEHASLASDPVQEQALKIVASRRFPYGVNGIIDALTVTSGDVTTIDQVGIEIAREFDRRGAVSQLRYPLWLKDHLRALVDGATVAADSSYYAVLVSVKATNALFASAANDNNLSCVTTPANSGGYYGIIALLSGAERGIYGQDRGEDNLFPSAPFDRYGGIPFA